MDSIASADNATNSTTNTMAFASIYDLIFNNTFNKCPTNYKSLQINYYKEINKISKLLSDEFTGRKLKFTDETDKTIIEFFIRTTTIMLINREISNTPINIILSNFGGTHKAIIVNTSEFKNGYKLIKNQLRDNYQYKTKFGWIHFDVGYFENRKIDSQIVFRHELAIRFAKNNIMLKGVLMTRLNCDATAATENTTLLECREYLESMEEVLVDESADIYKETDKLVSAQIQTQYMMLQIVASIIVVEQKMI